MISKKKVILFTASNYESGAFGDAVNDRKLIEAIPSIYDRIVINPKYSKGNKLKLFSILKFFINYIKVNLSSNNIFITHGGKLAIIPILLRKIFKNKVVVRLGCTPLMFVERIAFSHNLEFESKPTIFHRLYYFIETHLEKYALCHADKFIVENTHARKLIILYGAQAEKIKIIPYYVQDYFLKGSHPSYDKNNEYFKIGYTGRFKKYDLLIPVLNAILQLKTQKYRIMLYLIGDGPTRENIEKLVKEKGLDENIKFLGPKSHEEVSLLIEEYHCLILLMLNNLCPSTIAIKILEGIMKGKIIITTNSGNNSSLFLDQNDLILKTINEQKVAEKIKMVINNYEKYRKIAEILKKYHMDKRSKEIYQFRIEELIKELINNNRLNI